MKDVVDSLPFSLQDNENIPVNAWKLTATIWSKTFNYKQAVESIELDKG